MMILGVLCLVCGAGAQPPADMASSELFDRLWPTVDPNPKEGNLTELSRVLFSSMDELFVIQITGVPDSSTGRELLPVRVVGRLRPDDKFKPSDLKLGIHYVRNYVKRDAIPKPSPTRYLLMLRNIEKNEYGPTLVKGAEGEEEDEEEEEPTKPKAEWVVAHDWIKGRSGTSPFIALPTHPDKQIAAIRELLFGRDTAGKEVDLYVRGMRYLASPDKTTRNLAACVAGRTALGLDGAESRPAKFDQYATFLLSQFRTTSDTPKKTPAPKRHPDVSRRLAQAYLQAKSDILPRDAKLLAALLGHDDSAIARAALGGIFRSRARSQALAPLLRPFLTGPNGTPKRRSMVLWALKGWKKKSMLLEKELTALARATDTNATDRWRALTLLLYYQASEAPDLVRIALAGKASLIALDYAVTHHQAEVVPILAQALQKRKYRWTPGLAAAVRLLTGEEHSTSREFLQWWQKLQADGQADAAVKRGFARGEQVRNVAVWIQQLSSRKFSEREAARKNLLAWEGPIPQALKKLAQSQNPEERLAAEKILAELKEQDAPDQEAITSLAKQERSNGFRRPPWP